MGDLGYRNLTAEQLAELSRFGVDAELVRTLKQLGYENLSVAELIQISRHGVDPDFIRSMLQDLGPQRGAQR
jgi:hypothetical protein